MPTLNPSELNVVLAIFGGFIILYGILSVKIKNVWYLGEALPAVVLGICLGPIAAKFLDSERWGSAVDGQTNDITLGVMRVMIGIQLVMAGYQLPAKYQKTKWKDMLVLMIPVMTLMWLATSACILATIPKVSLLGAMVIGSCVTSTDPVLSQAVAKGPFSDKYVRRSLREIISSEAGANDGFGFPFLMLATYLMRHADGKEALHAGDSTLHAVTRALLPRAGDVARQGGGVGIALQNWFLETWLYFVIMSIAYGVVVGTLIRFALKFSVRKNSRKWIDSESYVLVPTAIGLFLMGTSGAIGTDDLLSCFVAGSALNWDGEYLAEAQKRHDEVNASIDVLLNFGGFIYLGTIIPWSEFNSDITGITPGRLFGLGALVLVFRRIPAVLLTYKLMPNTIKNWKEALFMGYFGPIGVGAAFYIEHARHVFPKAEEAAAVGDNETADMLRAMGPVVYWLALFSIFVHGLSIPILSAIYKFMGVQPIQEDAVQLRRRSLRVPPPSNAVEGDRDTFIAFNRFSRPNMSNESLTNLGDDDSTVVDEKVRFPDLETGLAEAKKRAQLNPRRSFNVPRLAPPRSLSRPRTSASQVQWDQQPHVSRI
ncbi:Na(+)/H(+) antiporter C3A11.09-like protein 1 [Colletotrichum truncatum]|uniref:Na(+)/H(+) antiporter C3A11.09-like protein 1 n=1 Tax=Colletotrichum truncatum TaxID=5467 RepID=A0ACC3YUA8_COLTU|nr:Na(+)/H(+) antiporter C3A11.09-like protein 1 [Colletotrichum truncatum]KAF6798648.1 Na(+)/H(+) antiporter C3A11.09-like protein 1 [Colletotrichum truncatum]